MASERVSTYDYRMVKCPKCGGKFYVKDIVKTPEDEIYRKKECRSCGNIIYTVEFEIEHDDRLKDIWTKHRRHGRNTNETT